MRGLVQHRLPAAALFGCAFAFPAFAQDAAIAVQDQRVESGNIVKVQEVTAPADGFLVIHASPSNEAATPDKPIGYAVVNSGSNSNVSVKLEQDVPAGEKLVAVLHEDASDARMFDPARDKPLAKADGQTVMATFVAK
jgi:hypothetical protein